MKSKIMILLIIICLLLSACSNNETGNGSSAIALNSTYDSSNLVGSESIDGETDIENDLKTNFININDAFETANNYNYSSDVKFYYADTVFIDERGDIVKPETYDTIYTPEEHMHIKAYPVTNYFDELSTGYTTINDSKTIWTSAYWNPIITNVLYTKYSNDTSFPDGWENLIYNTLQKKGVSEEAIINTPVIVKESWSFETDIGNIDIISANNLIRKEEDEYKIYSQPQEFPCNIKNYSNGEHIIYEIYLILCNNKPIYEYVNFSVFYDNLLNYPQNGERVSDMYTVWVNDADGNAILCQMFAISDNKTFREIALTDKFAYLDINGDGIGEIVEDHPVYSTNYIGGITIWKLTDEGLKWLGHSSNN